MNVQELRKERDRLMEVVTALDHVISLVDTSHIHTNGKGKCLVRGCNRVVKYRGICNQHYSIWSQSRDGWDEIEKVMLPSRTGRRSAKK